MEQIVFKNLHRADTRGTADFGWLHSRHTFSFGSYFDPQRMNFGLLRVLNDDIVEGGAGFGTHPHNNMEIISVPLSGALEHKDTEGNVGVIRTGDVQIMSAGSGIAHSEYNHSQSDLENFLQIWVMPKDMNIQPRYEQKSVPAEERRNRFQTVVSPDRESGGVWINQDAYFSLGNVDAGGELEYRLQRPEHGLYLFVIEGAVEVGGETLGKRDAIGLAGPESFSVKATQNAELLAIEVPMN